VDPVGEISRCDYNYATFTAEHISSLFCVRDNMGFMYKLSGQQIIDCSTGFGNQGCGGGKLKIFVI
jgi:hypothetical protein